MHKKYVHSTIDSVDFVLYEIIFVMFHFEITQPRGDRTEFCFVGALEGCELNTGAQSFDLFSEADHISGNLVI